MSEMKPDSVETEERLLEKEQDVPVEDNDKAYDKKDVRQLVDDPRQNHVPGKAWERKISHVPGTVWTHKPGCRHS